MLKTDPTVKKETVFIAVWSVLFSLLMEAVFLVLSRWDYTVLLGNLLGLVISVGNFFLLGLTVQKAVTKDEKEAKTVMKLSQTYRNLGIVVLVGLGIILDCFNTVAVILPVFFPRIAIVFRPLFDKKADK